MRVRDFFQGPGLERNRGRARRFFQKGFFRPKNDRVHGWGWLMNREFLKRSFQFPWSTQNDKREHPPVMDKKTVTPKDLFEKCRKFTRATEVKKSGVYPYFCPIESSQEPEITLEGRKMLMLGSNSYLGLTTHPKVKEAALSAVRRYGSSCAGSRFLNGTLVIHEQLEEKLAEFVGKEQAIVFTTGFQTNLGTIATLVGKGDRVITDKVDHASIIDGARLSYGRMLRFNHNSAEDLERVLAHCDGRGGRLVVVDGVFSMDGDIVELPSIVEVAERWGAQVMVDDAHGLGVMGPMGRGTTEHFGLTDRVALIMGTFSKSFASIGGFVAGDNEVMEYVRHHSRSLIFSASLPPAQVASVLAVLDIIKEEPDRLDRLWDNTHYLRNGLDSLGFDTGCSETPIIPVMIGKDMLCFQTWQALRDEGIFVNPIITPAVLPGQALIRVSIMATHERHHLDRGLAVFEKVGKKLGLIE